MFEFSSKILVTNIFIQTNNNIFSLLLGRLFSTAEVGYYTQANKWDNMGYSLIGNMVNGVAQPVLTAVSDDQDRQRNVFRKMLRFTSFISFPAMFGLALVAHELIVIAVTDKWLPCVTILQWLCIWGAFFPITTLYTNLIISKGKSNIYMWNTIALGVLQLVALLFAHPYGIQTMIITFVLINVGWLFIWQYFVWRLLRLTLIKALKDILPFAFFALATMAVTYFITLNVSNIYLVFTIKIIIATAIYIFTMWVTNSVVFKESMQFLLNRKK